MKDLENYYNVEILEKKKGFFIFLLCRRAVPVNW